MPTLATALLQGLKDHGAREVFGIPGDFVLPLYKVIEESRILPHYTLSHEPAVGFAADAAARYRASIGVAVIQPGETPSVDELLRRADVAMYHAKAAGKHRLATYVPAMDMAPAAVPIVPVRRKQADVEWSGRT